jgi:hypothetical protein
MKTKNKQAAPAEPTNTITNANPCIFSTADRKRLKPLLSNESFDQLMKLVAGEPMPSPLVDSNGEEIRYNEMDKIAIQSWHDGNEEYIYQIGKTVYAYYDDRSDFLVYEESHVTCVIEYGYPREDGYWEEKCVQFEVKPPLTPAKRSGSGSCRVWINTFYRNAYLRAGDLSRWAREENGDITVFESYSAARRWIYQDKKEHHGYADIVNPKGQYLYKHNEYAPRKYKICQ